MSMSRVQMAVVVVHGGGPLMAVAACEDIYIDMAAALTQASGGTGWAGAEGVLGGGVAWHVGHVCGRVGRPAPSMHMRLWRLARRRRGFRPQERHLVVSDYFN